MKSATNSPQTPPPYQGAGAQHVKHHHGDLNTAAGKVKVVTVQSAELKQLRDKLVATIDPEVIVKDKPSKKSHQNLPKFKPTDDW